MQSVEEIVLGSTETGPLLLDLERLIGSHLGIIANAGGGKSGLIRRLLEQTYGQIQHIVLDIEDEYYTLRERHDYVIAGGEAGDTAATVQNAASLARAALAHGFSLICQLNDLGGQGASEFVEDFLAAMITAPQEHWRPCLVVIDEAQRFNPDSIRMLTERGRKRGFTAVLASQRLPKIEANIRGDLNNWIMGRVGQSLDRNIMADQLGFAKREANEKLARIEPRHFWAFGPALSRDPVLFRGGDVETTMVRPGQAKVQTPPAPEALREILAGLAVAKSESSNDTDPATDIIRHDGDLLARIADLETERDALRDMVERKSARIEKLIEERADRENMVAEAIIALRAALPADRAPGAFEHDLHSPSPSANTGGSHEVAATKSEKASRTARSESPHAVRSSGAAELNAAARKMLEMLERIAPARVTWTSLAAMVGNKARGGNFNTARKAMRESGLIVEDGETVRWAGSPGTGMARAEAIALWKEMLSNPAPRMIKALEGGPKTREQIGAALGIVPRGGNFNTGISQLLRNGVAIDTAGVLSLADPLPGEF